MHRSHQCSLNAESVVGILLSYLIVFIGKIYNIAVSVLRVIGILGLVSVSVVVLSDKVRTTDIAIGFIELVINNVRNDLFAAVLDVMDRLSSFNKSTEQKLYKKIDLLR